MSKLKELLDALVANANKPAPFKVIEVELIIMPTHFTDGSVILKHRVIRTYVTDLGIECHQHGCHSQYVQFDDAHFLGQRGLLSDLFAIVKVDLETLKGYGYTEDKLEECILCGKPISPADLIQRNRPSWSSYTVSWHKTCFQQWNNGERNER